MALPKVKYQGKTILFASDLVPTAGHIPVPYLMGYDVRPLVTMDEKFHVLKSAVEQNTLLFMQHDPYNEIVVLKNYIRIFCTRLNCKESMIRNVSCSLDLS